jgi:hypothetical protein
MKVLVIDVGGTHVKFAIGAAEPHREIASGPGLTAAQMVAAVKQASADFQYDVVSIGFPGPVRRDQILAEPHNLGRGWVGFDFAAAFGKPVHVVNDAVMQALGSYRGGSMLFLGLGTGLGCALIVDGAFESLEVAHLPYKDGYSYEDCVGVRGLERLGEAAWRSEVLRVVSLLKAALPADELVLGGGNVHRLGEPLPEGGRRGDNHDALLGGVALWQTKRTPPPSAAGSAGKERVVTLFDVDNTLLDNDRIIDELARYLEREVGAANARSYFEQFEQLRSELGYADYLGALQRFREQHPHQTALFAVSSFLLDYPFANRLFPGALDVIEKFAQFGPCAILSDGDVVFQPHKIRRSGLFEAVRGNVLIYIHKEQELAEIERRLPAEHYVLVDDKVRLLDAIKKQWGARVTTVFPRQGHYARDAHVADYPAPDLSVARIGDLLDTELAPLLPATVRRP